MECPKCASKCSDDSRYCSQCGAALFESCLSCGRELSKNDRFCPNCGNRISLSSDIPALLLDEPQKIGTVSSDDVITISDNNRINDFTGLQDSTTRLQNEQHIQNQELDQASKIASNLDNKSSDIASDEINENNVRIHWDSVIDGHPFRFAAYYSYFGIWIGVIGSLVSLFFLYEFLPLFVLSSVLMIMQILIGTGLYRLKRYAFVVLIIGLYLILCVSGIAFIIYATFGDAYSVIQNLVSCVIQIPFIIYFMKRSSAYNR